MEAGALHSHQGCGGGREDQRIQGPHGALVLQGKRSEDSKPMVLQVLPSVTTVAEEETAPVLI